MQINGFRSHVGQAALARMAVMVMTWLAGLLPIDVMAQAPALSNCLWVGPVAAGEFNAGYPDEGAAYWYAEYQLPPGATLKLRGEFPRARYMSLNSYDTAGLPTDVLTDVALVPDKGSSNPFAESARRSVRERSYAMEVVGQPKPAGERRPNTLYAGVAGQSVQKLLYRVYVPDAARDVAGGAGLPRHELRLSDGTLLYGDVACQVMGANPARDIPFLRLKMPVEQFVKLRAPVPNLPETHPAANPPEWEGSFGASYGRTRYLKGTPREAERARVPTTLAGGGYSNADIAYIVTDVDLKFGAVLMLRGKAPTTPRTRDGAEIMQAAQLRYWSICKNESPATTRYVACLYDEQVPLDSAGFYTIAMSTGQDRPENAVDKCGVAWLNAGTTGDGVDRPTAGSLLMRHMLPAPTFEQAFQKILTPKTEAQVLGAYLPIGTYMSRQQFEARGCTAAGVASR
jgi:hypothetical protein